MPDADVVRTMEGGVQPLSTLKVIVLPGTGWPPAERCATTWFSVTPPWFHVVGGLSRRSGVGGCVVVVVGLVVVVTGRGTVVGVVVATVTTGTTAGVVPGLVVAVRGRVERLVVCFGVVVVVLVVVDVVVVVA